MIPIRLFVAVFVALVVNMARPTVADAAPAQGSGSFNTNSGGRSSGSGFDWPEMVVSGNAVSFLSPLQIGMVSYLPKVRLAFQYDRQLLGPHWIFGGVGLLLDRGDWRNFRLENCGLGANTTGGCEAGTVAGVDVYAGYAHKFYYRKRPFIVPIARGSIGYSFWALPTLGGGDGNRQQSRTRSWGLTLRPGGGVRLFFTDQLSAGFDLNLPFGFLIHTVRDSQGDTSRDSAFLIGVEILPLIVEYRF